MRKTINTRAIVLGFALQALALTACAPADRRGATEWRHYGGSALGDRYSMLTQIDRTNVAALQVAWRYDTGPGGLQTTPLVVDGLLYGYTPTQAAFALDAVTGRKVWEFQHQADVSFAGSPFATNQQPIRGMTYWRSGGQRRLFVPSLNYLYALDPRTGRPIASFGENGRIDLRQNLDRDPETIPVFLTTPGVIFRDLIIVGFRTAKSAPAAPGDIRAYDVRSGALRWSFHTIPQAGEAGHETWPPEAWRTAGGANNWAGMVVDEERGLVFASTGSAVPDFYGADRGGDNLYANSLIALDARTGRRRWHFQGVHHDTWDRDFPSPPVLLTVQRSGRRIDAVAQASKQGFMFVFDRASGEPLFPIEERPVEQSAIPGEQSARTQPFPLLPAPFSRTEITEDTLAIRTPAAHARALQTFRSMRSGPLFTPWSPTQPTLLSPGFDGGASWGGQAVDRDRGVIYVNANNTASFTSLLPAPPPGTVSRGEELYLQNCASCHRIDRAGSPPEMPSLHGVNSRYLDSRLIGYFIRQGSGRMPGFPQLSPTDANSIVQYLVEADSNQSSQREVQARPSTAASPGYTMNGYNSFVDHEGYPASAPPWGTLSAIDLNTGEYLWQTPLGEYPALAAAGLGNTGTQNYGGPIVTAGGIVIIGATIYDRKIRAFNSTSGEVLWQADLPFAGVATPITYMADGRQYIVIATSGARDRAGPQGSAYIAFAFRQRSPPTSAP